MKKKLKGKTQGNKIERKKAVISTSISSKHVLGLESIAGKVIKILTFTNHGRKRAL
jgi:hypothetical protein